jgi:2,3-bisphosphoglycerate-independent phosphoglycerate mutase
MKKPITLIILDGWGYSEDTKYNAISQANPEYFNYLWQTYPHTLFAASGESVGLPEGIIGTSEIGHTVIGAGKILYTDMVRVSNSIKTGEFNTNESFQKLFNHVKINNSTLHVQGLVSPGGVHSHQDHLFAFLRLAKESGITKLVVHVFTDGRDTPPQSAKEYVKRLEDLLEELGVGRIVSVSGRYYAMDRDNNWDRIQKAEDAIFHGKGNVSHTAAEAIESSYQTGIHDEFIIPTIIADPVHVSQNDGIFFFNFRPDRAREISERIVGKKKELNLFFVTLTQYDKSIDSEVAFPPIQITATLAGEIAKAGLSQVHIAETEKYAHVTYFLNGGQEKPHEKEEFILIDSRKDISTHDLAPEMKAKEIADKAIESIENGTEFVALNLANADMVGHTGKWDATLKAVKFEDEQIKRIVEATLQKGGVAFITADHGNAEVMFNEKINQPSTSHSLNPVPGIITIKGISVHNNGTLADIAPTILELLEIPKPTEMTGSSLIQS